MWYVVVTEKEKRYALDVFMRERGFPIYVPDVFPDFRLHEDLARQTSDPNLKKALKDYWYPYKESELLADNKYSPDIKLQILALDKSSNHG